MFASLNLRAFLNFTKFLCSASFKRVLQIHYHSIWGQSHQAALQFFAMFGLHHKRWVSPSLSLLVISILSASFISLWSWTIVLKSSFLSVLFITFCSLCSKLVMHKDFLHQVLVLVFPLLHMDTCKILLFLHLQNYYCISQNGQFHSSSEMSNTQNQVI